MATLYEIDAAILECIDTETGEVVDVEKLEGLQMQREEKIEAVALWYKNLCADAAAYKAEKESFAEKEAAAKKKIEGLKNWLDYALNGQKLATRRVTINFRKSKVVEIENETAFIRSAQANGQDDLLTYKEPTISKTAVRAAIEAGQDITGAHLVERRNIQIK